MERTVEEMLEYSKDLSVGNWKKIQKKSEGSFKKRIFTMSFSYGVVEYDSREEGINRKSADENMYRVKRAKSGKKLTKFFTCTARRVLVYCK